MCLFTCVYIFSMCLSSFHECARYECVPAVVCQICVYIFCTCLFILVHIFCVCLSMSVCIVSVYVCLPLFSIYEGGVCTL